MNGGGSGGGSVSGGEGGGFSFLKDSPVLQEKEQRTDSYNRTGATLDPQERIAYWQDVLSQKKYFTMGISIEQVRKELEYWTKEASRSAGQTGSKISSSLPGYNPAPGPAQGVSPPV